jgi:hypothetical protein
MTAAERLADVLRAAGHVRGFKKAVYRNHGRVFDHYAIHHIEVMASDIYDACRAVPEAVAAADETVSAWLIGASGHAPDHKVTVYSDQLYHLIDLATPAPVTPVANAPGSQG